MFKVRSFHALFIAILLFAATSFAQEEIFFLGSELGVGARAMSMGGAYIGVSDDYSAMYWNPAGLGQVRRMEMNVGFSHNRASNSATFLGEKFDAENTFTRLNSIGFVFPVPTYRGSLVFGIGYNKIRDFDNTLEINGFNPRYAAYPNKVIPTYPEEDGFSTIIDDSLFQSQTLLEEGGLNHFTLSGALEVQENFYLGASINFVSGTDDYTIRFGEEDIFGIYNRPFDAATGIIADLDYWNYEYGIISKFSATNIKIGALYRMGNAVRVGATIVTPTQYKITENWRESFEEFYDWGAEDPFERKGEFQYTIQEPYSFGVGASLKFVNLMLSGGAEFKDWSQAKFRTEPPVAGISKGDINLRIKQDFKAVTKLHLGAEFYLPVIRARLRAGWSDVPSAYRYTNIVPDKEFLTAGISLLLDKQVMFDAGLVHGSWKQETTDDLTGVATLEERSFDKIIGTLSIRF